MSERVVITCPACQHQFSSDDAFAEHLKEQLEYQLEQERAKVKKDAFAWAQQELKTKLGSKDEELASLQKKVEAAQAAELTIRKQKNELQEQKRTMELELQRQLDVEREKIRQETIQQALEQQRFKEKEKDKIIEDLKQDLAEAQRKASQGSQQTQGEVLELELENVLMQEFPYDEINPVAKGVLGADILQIVHDHHGRGCGTIIWESKNTKNWQPLWLDKLKDDQRAKKAEMAVLVSAILPSEIKKFGAKEGIYITSYDCFIEVAKILRTYLIGITATKLSVIGKNEKMEVIYNYLSSPGFTHHIEATVEGLVKLRDELEKEKRVYTQVWSRREKQIQRVIDSAIGMHGDLQGIMGNALPALPALELETLSDDEGEQAQLSLGGDNED